MPRTRSLKASFFTNEDLGECSPLARLLFAGLWCWSDREGYVEDRPRRLRAQILPYDSAEGETLVAELVEHGLVERLVVNGEAVLRLPTFLKHQDPHPRETPSRFAQGAPKANLAGISPAKPSCPSSPSSPSSLPSPHSPLASVPDWLAGIQEELGKHMGHEIVVGKDPEAVVEAFTARLGALTEQYGDEAELRLLGDCIAIASRSKTGLPSTLSYFVGWFERVQPKAKGGVR
jgi:hypothetical protein